ncbi:hypothetical protein CRYUN_Cryun23aG0138700 [Craigia yunnanensis]
MDNLSSSDENYDLGYQPSPSIDQNDQSTIGIPGCSTLSDSVDHSCCSEASPSHWPATRSGAQNQAVLTRLGTKQRKSNADEKLDDQEALDLELEMMKERFTKLLLGEDMSGSGKGVCTAVTISNAKTNLYATVFG